MLCGVLDMGCIYEIWSLDHKPFEDTSDGTELTKLTSKLGSVAVILMALCLHSHMYSS